ncbi:hypothetical protein [Leptolyngbya ohadii]|uniref:hypothetical protein n=1 Tax=Leptolyngbya ohadii TaxID=1962290 RepID=UPI000B5992E2|nr:hypothetical protein [Leptolyngbya ohadii]
MTGKRSVSPQYVAYIQSSGWKVSLRRKIALNLLFGRDPIIPLLKAHDVEHLSYRRIDFESCVGYEIPFLDLMPLNRFMHRQVVTPVKDVLRKRLGRRLGNAIVAYSLRFCLLFWYGVLLVLGGIFILLILYLLGF